MGWPDEKRDCHPLIGEYWNFREEISVVDGLILKNTRIVIPKSLRSDMLNKIHTGHFGQEKCRQRARNTVFWPGISKDITVLVNSCNACQEQRPRQPAQASTSPRCLCARTSTRPSAAWAPRRRLTSASGMRPLMN